MVLSTVKFLLHEVRRVTSNELGVDSCIYSESRDPLDLSPPGNEYSFTFLMGVKLGVARIGPGAMYRTWSEDGHDAGAMSPPEDGTVSRRLRRRSPSTPVSYTHLTLPTILLV